MVGQQVDSDLLVLRRIGEGGMASVWAAEDTSRGHNVALKVLAPDLAIHPEVVERFVKEAEATARIDSPYVPKIYDHGSLPDGTPFIVMELLEGADLGAYLAARGRLSTSVTARIVSQVASALSVAHRLGIVHRDVKPENIFVTGSEDELVAKLFDFGIARIPSEDDVVRLTQMGALMGTPSYMSAEQLLSAKDVDRRADLWSLAVVAYLALTGRLPFEGETFGAVCVAIHEGTFDLPSALDPHIPPQIDAWISKALSRDADHRFQTAEAFTEALMDAVGAPREQTADTLEPPERRTRPSLRGVARTHRGTRESRRPSLAAFALCAGSIAYLGTSPLPASLPNVVVGAGAAVAGFAKANKARLKQVSAEVHRAAASMAIRTPSSVTDAGLLVSPPMARAVSQPVTPPGAERLTVSGSDTPDAAPPEELSASRDSTIEGAQ
jgi:serine/threonine protein kinase